MTSKTSLAVFCFVALSAHATGQAEIRVTMADAIKAAVNKPQPEYAPLAKQAKIAGDVVVEVKISPSGEVSEVTPVSGNTLLTNPVLKTIRQWKFKPFEAEGKATAAVTNLRFSFKN